MLFTAYYRGQGLVPPGEWAGMFDKRRIGSGTARMPGRHGAGSRDGSPGLWLRYAPETRR